MTTICSNHSDEKICIVNRLYDANTYDSYVFVNDSSKLKSKDFADANTKNVVFVEKSIYQDDSVKIIRQKIAETMNVSKDKDVYMFTKIPMTEDSAPYALEDFLKKMYGSRSEVLVRRMNAFFIEYFNIQDKTSTKYPIKYKDEKESISYDDALYQLKPKMKSTSFYNFPISYDLSNSRQLKIMFAINPYNSLINDDDVIYKNNTYYNFHDLKDMIYLNDMIIYVVLRKDLEDYGNIHFTVNKDYILDLYFPEEIQDINEKNTRLIRYMDNIKDEINNFNFSTITDKVDCFVVSSKIVINNIKNTNILRLFNMYQTTKDIPFISYKNKSNDYFYRLLKNNLQTSIEKSTFLKWIDIERRSIMARRKDILSLKVRYKDTMAFASINIRETGYYSVYLYTNTVSITYSDLMEFYETLNSTVIADLGLTSIIPDTNAWFEELKINTLVTTKLPILNTKTLTNQFSNNPFFSLIKSKTKDEFLIRYKKVADYNKVDNITSFITSKLGLPYENIIQELMNEFNMDEETAKIEYNNKKDGIKLKKLNNDGNIVYVPKYNEGILVNIKINNQNQFQSVTSKIDNPKYHNNIIRALLLLTSSQSDITLTINKAFGKQLENFLDDSSDSADNDITLSVINNLLKSNSVAVSRNSPRGSFASFDSLEDIDDEEELDDAEIQELNIDNTLLIEENNQTTFNDQNMQTLNNTVENPDDFKDIKEVDMKSYTSRFINSKLKEADKELFSKKYSKSCPAVDKKMPVVISKSEKDKIDTEHPDSYSGYVKAGSTKELKNKNYYICPMVWCPISRVSLSYKELQANKGKCPKPYEETPISLHKKGVPNKKEGEYYKYPYFMNKNLHPTGKEMVCCGYLMKPKVRFDTNAVTNDTSQIDTMNMTSNNMKMDRYIKRGSNVPLQDNRLGTLPYELHNLLNPTKEIDSCSGMKNDKKAGCFLRKGLNTTRSKNNTFIQALGKTLNIKNFVNHVVENLTTLDYIFLNNGNTLRTFMKYNADLYDAFRIHFLSDKDYIKQLNLQDIQAYLEDKSELSTSLNSYVEQITMREFLIYCSMKNFMDYILDTTIVKEPEDVMDLTQCVSINPSKNQYIIMEIYRDNSEDIYMLCPKYSENTINIKFPLTILLKLDNNYEQLVRFNSNEAKMKKPFSATDIGISALVDVYKNNCHNNPSKIERFLPDTLLVLDYNTRIVGTYDKSAKKFQPFPQDHIYPYKNLENKIMYIDTLEALDTNYRNHAKEQLKVFIGYQYVDKRIDSIHKYTEYKKNIVDSVSEILKTFYAEIEFRKKYFLIKHELNPFTHEEKQNHMLELLKEWFPSFDKQILKVLSVDAYTKDIDILDDTVYESPIFSKENEYIFDKSDILNDTFLAAYYKSNNPYKVYNTSLEDMDTFETIKDPNLFAIEKKVKKMTLEIISIKPSTLYKKYYIDKSMKALKAPLKTVYNYILENNGFSNDFVEKELSIYSYINGLKTSSSAKKNTRFWVNLYDNNAFVTTNNDIKKSMKSMNTYQPWESPEYSYGILEIVNLANIFDAGLILLTKTKSDPNDYQLKVVNNTKILIFHPIRYIMINVINNEDDATFYICIENSTENIRITHDIDILTNKMRQLLETREAKEKPEESILFLRHLYDNME